MQPYESGLSIIGHFGRNFLNDKPRGVGCENRLGFDNLVEFLKHILFQFELFGYGLDNEIHVCKVFKLCREIYVIDYLLGHIETHLAALDRTFDALFVE